MSDGEISDRLEALEEKVDECVRLLKGEAGGHGLIARVDRHSKTLYGTDLDPGLVGRVRVVWSTHVWLWCTLSASAGSLLTWLVMHSIR